MACNTVKLEIRVPKKQLKKAIKGIKKQIKAELRKPKKIRRSLEEIQEMAHTLTEKWVKENITKENIYLVNNSQSTEN